MARTLESRTEATLGALHLRVLILETQLEKVTEERDALKVREPKDQPTQSPGAPVPMRRRAVPSA